MTGVELEARCLIDMAEEWAHLASLLPAGVLPVSNSDCGAGDERYGCAVLTWARSGLMHLTGPAAGPPLAPAAPVMARAALIAAAIAELTGGQGRPVRLDVDHAVAYRAALAGWTRGGTVSANGRCRILPAKDGWLAVNLARPSDLECLPALLGRELRASPWDELAALAAASQATGLAAAAQVLGIPAAPLGADGGEAPSPVRNSQAGAPGNAPRVVLDLSAMWAGPLCAHILGRAGWRVLKVEDVRRPDPARSWLPAFYQDLHAGSQSVRLDFGTAEGRAALAALADRAGIVVEASRPRALRRLGLVAEDWLARRPGRVWLSVTGYGRDDPCQRAAFGDDAAVAAGLVARCADGTPVFCGDAIADPLTGLLAGLAALAAHAAGGGFLVDVAMAGVCADLARPASTAAYRHPVSASQGPGGACWTVRHPPGAPERVIPARS